VTALAARLDRVLFAPTAAVPVAVFRIMLAVVFAIVCWPADRATTGPDTGVAAFDSVSASVFLTSGYWWIVLSLLVLFGAGVHPRVTGWVAVAVLLPSMPLAGRQQSRQVLLFTLLAFAFLRSDAALALGRRSRVEPVGPGPRWPLLLIRVQLSLLYGVNALAKTTPDFLGGEVLGAMSRMLPNFSVDLSGGSVEVAGVPVPVWLLAVATVLVEYALAVGFWFRRLRWPTAMLGVLFHLVSIRIVTIRYLHLASVFLYTSFLLPFDRVEADGRAPASHRGAG